MSSPSQPQLDRQWRIQRSFPRFALELPVAFAESRESETMMTGTMVDIGLGGLCAVLADVELHPRQKLFAEFRFKGQAEALRIRVMVRHHEAGRYGFQFLDIRPEQRDRIRMACQGLPIV
jgi:c-di-GMP-binding flagellar brake protein YcgR